MISFAFDENMKTNNKQKVTLGQAFGYWLKLGFISFGGPAGQIAIMHQDVVEKKRWLSEKRFLHALNFCMVLPGPEAQQLATYIGWLMHRFWGGVMAGGLFVLPSFFMLTALGYFYMAYGDIPMVAGLFYGIKAAVVAIVFFACYRIGGRVLKNPFLYVIAGGAFGGVFLLHAPFPLIVGLAGVIGAVAGRHYPRFFNASGHGAGKVTKKNILHD